MKLRSVMGRELLIFPMEISMMVNMTVEKDTEM